MQLVQWTALFVVALRLSVNLSGFKVAYKPIYQFSAQTWTPRSALNGALCVYRIDTRPSSLFSFLPFSLSLLLSVSLALVLCLPFYHTPHLYTHTHTQSDKSSSQRCSRSDATGNSWGFFFFGVHRKWRWNWKRAGQTDCLRVIVRVRRCGLRTRQVLWERGLGVKGSHTTGKQRAWALGVRRLKATTVKGQDRRVGGRCGSTPMLVLPSSCFRLSGWDEQIHSLRYVHHVHTSLQHECIPIVDTFVCFFFLQITFRWHLLAIVEGMSQTFKMV